MELKKMFVAVIGTANAGKSTIIQSLTGCKTKTFRGEIKDKKTRHWVYVSAASPEEMPFEKGELEKEMRSAATGTLSLGMVIALQPRKTRTRLSMKDVLEMAKKYKSMRPYVFVLTKPYDDNTADETDLTDIPNILGKPRQLDGRRFAHVNAREIANIVGWF